MKKTKSLFSPSFRLLFFCLILALTLWGGQGRLTLSAALKPFVVLDAPTFAITHVRVIDGTGQPPLEDQTVIVSDGKIKTIGPSSSTLLPAEALVLEKPGCTLIPGLVGMHDHLFYPAGGAHYNTLEFIAPRLYLGCGVTTIRTTGSLEPYAELNLKRAINEGRVPGPRIYVTSPYLEGPGAFTFQMNELTGAEDAIRFVQYWAAEGVDDFKAYTHIQRQQLEAAIKEIHRLGKKIVENYLLIHY